MDTLYIVMPAYNEEDNIEEVVRAWHEVVAQHNSDGKSRLIVFNDGSKDNTLNKGRELMKELPFFEMIDKENSGHGPTVIYGYDYAISHGADYIFQTDSDGQTRPEEFEKFWEMRHEYDGIFGHRVNRQDGLVRKIVACVVKLLINMYFGVRVKDANAPFRLMKAEVLKKYIEKLPKDYNLPNIMITTYFTYYKEKMCYNPITFKPRQGGVNSINLKKIIKIGIKALHDFSRLKHEMKS